MLGNGKEALLMKIYSPVVVETSVTVKHNYYCSIKHCWASSWVGWLNDKFTNVSRTILYSSSGNLITRMSVHIII